MAMRGVTFESVQHFVVEECCNCGVAFAFPKEFKDECLKNRGPNGRAFYCPNGHRQWYTGESEADALRRERDRLKQDAARLEEQIARERDLRANAERRVSAARGQITKLHKRVGEGHCPCCNRGFVNLRRHMAAKHPDFKNNVVEFKAEAV